MIEFSVKNFLSFRDRQTLSLVMAKGNELQTSNTFKTDVLKKVDLLRSAAIYGSNAGGKSNFLMALQTMKEIVLESATELKHGDNMPVVPFRLSQTTRQKPSEFEVIFIVDKIRYQYGFAVTVDRIIEEWLLAFPKGRPQQWLWRTWNEADHRYDWQLGNSLAGEKDLWKKTTRENALFLSTAIQLNSEQLRPVYDWFRRTLRTANIAGWTPAFSASLCEQNESEKRHIMDFLQAADLGIHDVAVKKKQFDYADLPGDMPTSLKETIGHEMKGKSFLEIEILHVDADGRVVNFDFADESHGTQKIFSLADPWIDALNNGYILFIDELHSGLHPHLLEFLVNLFNNSESNSKNAQLIFTTHETSILDQTLLRRDQIWFCEKDDENASKIYPLTDFRPRKGRENLEKSYLSGRYGGLPYVRPLPNRN